MVARGWVWPPPAPDAIGEEAHLSGTEWKGSEPGDDRTFILYINGESKQTNHVVPALLLSL